MSNVGKATDGMLDTILELQRNRDAAKSCIQFYLEAHMIDPEVADHLWQILTVENEQKEDENGDPVHSGITER